jgi:hypothetical protein
MKTRTGFVSNSSTTSFCIFGVKIDKNKLNLPEEEMEKLDKYTFYEYLEEEFNKNNMNFYIINDPDYDSEIYVGRSWSDIRDDETGRDFKLSIKNDFLKVFPNYKGEFSTYEEAWVDG